MRNSSTCLKPCRKVGEHHPGFRTIWCLEEDRIREYPSSSSSLWKLRHSHVSSSAFLAFYICIYINVLHHTYMSYLSIESLNQTTANLRSHDHSSYPKVITAHYLICTLFLFHIISFIYKMKHFPHERTQSCFWIRTTSDTSFGSSLSSHRSLSS